MYHKTDGQRSTCCWSCEPLFHRATRLKESISLMKKMWHIVLFAVVPASSVQYWPKWEPSWPTLDPNC